MSDKIHEDIQKAIADREAVMAHIRKVLSSPGYSRSSDAIEAAMNRLRAEGGIDREEFVIALLFVAVSLDTSDDLSPARFGRFMRVMTSTWETVVTARAEAERSEFIKAGGARA